MASDLVHFLSSRVSTTFINLLCLYCCEITSSVTSIEQGGATHVAITCNREVVKLPILAATNMDDQELTESMRKLLIVMQRLDDKIAPMLEADGELTVDVGGNISYMMMGCTEC
ncbi:uncharacterized protein LOC126660700 isoform X2 [Mercurialis annua]|uniref:uncharacterized protein LOC126660700 isoform X2 n=1 Tax=Mercurialis annua TaxID=3986 RepID=UPI0024AED3E3|nr:uncharacterized protein LOC126660700 isoform X2 [Mercurialis annua]